VSGRLLGVILIPLALLALVIAGSRVLAANRLDGPARAARLRAVASSSLAVLTALAFVLFSPWPEGEAVRLATMPALAALVAVMTAGVAEMTWPRPQGERREASIAVRRGTEARTLTRLLLAGLAVSGILLVVGGFTASADGDSVERRWALGAAGAGPYPGVTYAVPVGLALTALALATWWALGRVDARPALGADLEEVDRAIRLAARVRVLRFAAAGALLTMAGLAATMGTALTSVAQSLRINWPDAPQAPWDWMQNAGFVLIGLSVAAVVAAIYALLFDSPRVPALEPQERVEAATGVVPE
jgi:hypothetical protein